MPHLAVVFHSGYGHTKRLADAVAAGAAEVDGVHVSLLTTDEAMERLDDLDAADASVFGTPTYMGGPSGPFKTFADATSRKWLAGEWKDKLAAGFTISGSYSGDKSITLAYLITLAMQHKMIWVGQGEAVAMHEGAHGGKPEDVNRIGSSTGLMAQADNVAPDESPPSGDIRTAELFGARVAQAAVRWGTGS